jgi:alpha-galactosidase
VHAGELVHDATADGGAQLTGSVSDDRRWALYRLVREETSEWAVPPALTLPGLDPALEYRVRVLEALSAERTRDIDPPPWVAAGGARLTGALLQLAGLRAPLLAPGSALVLEVTAV